MASFPDHGPPFPTGDTSRVELVFAQRDTGALIMDLVLPPASAARVPVVVWVHGGGWFTGDRSTAPDLNRHFAARGIAMASIEYRLSGRALFPAQLHDVRAAVRYLRCHADRFGLDPEAIGLWGSSAGGHLAALAGVTGHIAELVGEADAAGLGDSRVQAVCDGYGPVDLALAVAEQNSVPSGADAPEARLIGGLPTQLPERARSASPLTHVGPQAPPFLIAHGTADVLVRSQQSVLLHEALVEAGVESTLYLVEGFRHGFFNPAGTIEVDGPTLMDDGRLDAEGQAEATRYYGDTGNNVAFERAPFSFSAIGDFFHHYLQQGSYL